MLTFNGVEIKDLFFNGQKIKELFFNGQKIKRDEPYILDRVLIEPAAAGWAQRIGYKRGLNAAGVLNPESVDGHTITTMQTYSAGTGTGGGQTVFAFADPQNVIPAKTNFRVRRLDTNLEVVFINSWDINLGNSWRWAGEFFTDADNNKVLQLEIEKIITA